jgi:hypothetical protein
MDNVHTVSFQAEELAMYIDCDLEITADLRREIGYEIAFKFFTLGQAQGVEVKDVEEVPVTWWDHFKMRFFPKMKRSMRKIETRLLTKRYNVCPHLHAGSMLRDNQRHIEFMTRYEPMMPHEVPCD